MWMFSTAHEQLARACGGLIESGIFWVQGFDRFFPRSLFESRRDRGERHRPRGRGRAAMDLSSTRATCAVGPTRKKTNRYPARVAWWWDRPHPLRSAAGHANFAGDEFLGTDKLTPPHSNSTYVSSLLKTAATPSPPPPHACIFIYGAYPTYTSPWVIHFSDDCIDRPASHSPTHIFTRTTSKQASA